MYRDILNLPTSGGLTPQSIWELERLSLTTLRRTQSLRGLPPAQARGLNLHDERIRRTHIVRINVTPDAETVTWVVNDGLIEVHKPESTQNTFKFCFKVPGATDSLLARGDGCNRLYVALAHAPRVWRFDFNHCGESEPNFKYVIPTTGDRLAHAAELTAVSPTEFAAAASDGSVYVFDARRARHVGAVRVPGAERAACIASSTGVIYTGYGGMLHAFDRRMLRPASSGSTRTLGGPSRRSRNGGTEALISRQVLPTDGGHENFVSINMMAGSSSAIAYQNSSGVVGHVDMLGDRDVRPGFYAERRGTNATLLHASLSRMAYARYMRECGCWWVSRPRGAVIPGAQGRGKRFFVPLVHGSGFRVIAMGEGMDEVDNVVHVETMNPVSCVKPLQEGRIAVGYASSKVDVFDVGRCREDGENWKAALGLD